MKKLSPTAPPGSTLLAMPIVSIFLALLLPAFADIAPHYSVMQGATSESTTYFTVMTTQDEPLSFNTRDENGNEISPTQVQLRQQDGSKWMIYRVQFTALKLQQNYHLQIFNSRGQLGDERRFVMLDRQARQGKIGFGSCMVRQLHNPFMWKAIANEKPDLFLILGDAVYLDRDELLHAQAPTSKLQVWESFAASRQKLDVYFWKDLIPVLSIWDDHDSGNNNDNALFSLMPQVREVYDTFFANVAIDGFLQTGPGMAKQFELFGKNFILLDGRSFRDLDDQSPLFGRDQERWLWDHVQPGQNFIMSGSQFFGKYIRKDSLEFNYPDYALGFTTVLREVGERKDARFIFGSGDVHFSEVQRLEPGIFGYETYELTSSSIHSFGLPGNYLFKAKNPRRLRATGTHNALMLELRNQDPSFNVRSVGWRGNDLFQIALSVPVPPPASKPLLTEAATSK